MIKGTPRQQRQRGVALVLLLLVLVPLIGLLGLAIDAAIYSISRIQLERTVQNASLAAMSRFLLEMDSSTSSIASQRFAAAKQRATAQANKILGTNKFSGTAFRTTPDPPTLPGAAGPSDGSIEFGFYYPEAPPALPAVAVACANTFPCFIPHEPTDTTATAVRIRMSVGGGMGNNNPLRPIFGRLVGAGDTGLLVEATSTRVVQNLAFLVDLSASVGGTNHLRFGVQYRSAGAQCGTSSWFRYPDPCSMRGSAATFAYHMAPNTCNAGTWPLHEWPYDTTGAGAGCCENGECLLLSTGESGWDPPGWWEILGGYWRRQCAHRDGGLIPAGCAEPRLATDDPENKAPDWAPTAELHNDRRIHVMNDYRPIEVDFGNDIYRDDSDTNPRTKGGEMPFLIDFRRTAPDSANCAPSQNEFCANPEPLQSILLSTGEAMRFVQTRRVPGDRFMVSGFDEFLFRSRLTCETSTGQTSQLCEAPTDRKFVAAGGQGDFLTFANMLSSGGLKGGTSEPPAFLQRGFFPRQLNTDGALALWDALLETNKLSTSRTSKNLLFLFTDGLFNCSTNADFTSLGSYVANRSCSTTGEAIWDALVDLERRIGPTGKTLVESLKDAKIAVSVFFYGPGAHRLVTRSYRDMDQPGCLTVEEAVNHNRPYVDSNLGQFKCSRATGNCDEAGAMTAEILKLAGGDPTADFNVHNELFEILVKPTRGTWAPILEPLRNAAGQSVNFVAALEGACNAASYGGTEISELQIDPETGQQVESGGVFVTDKAGRLRYDPLGRDAQMQIQNTLAGIVDPGFTLVEPRRN